ncbi:MAG: radical SAM protein [Muribaculaceae bacterium]|nr:radical SAM protein [Muribaculaceae bacterium]
MQTVLFTSTIFGPIHSRRLGTSLGVNLMPADGKVCSFDCLYCEAGFNAQGPGTKGIPPRSEVARLLEDKLAEMRNDNLQLDVITFSGNGEPTLHPDFNGVVDDVLLLRNKYYPEAKVSVLSNATRLQSTSVVEALRKVDNNILKLDSALDETVKIIDRPVSPGYRVADVIEGMKQFDGQCIVQTMMLRGKHNGVTIDNTTDCEIEALINACKEIAPREVMLYSIDRKTPAEHLEKVQRDELEKIAQRFINAGLKVQVS